MKQLALVTLSVAVLAVPAIAQGTSRSVQVRVGDGLFEAEVDGVVHRFDSAEALDAFLRARNLGSARFEKSEDAAGKPGAAPLPGAAGKGKIEVRSGSDGRYEVVVDGVVHRFGSAGELAAWLEANALGHLVPRALPGAGQALPGAGGGGAPRSVRIGRADGGWEIEVDGVVYRAASIEALDEFLRATGLGSASPDGICILPSELAESSR